MNIVWFKRDLRLEDHAALAGAARCGPVLLLYVLEKELWNQPDLSYRHYCFLMDCLKELDLAARALGHTLVIKVGSVVDVLEQISKKHPIQSLWSHQETWNGWTYQRDLEVKSWLKKRGITWFEPTQNGVVRRLKNRDGWAVFWHIKMKKKLIPIPENLDTVSLTSDLIPSPCQLGLKEDGIIFPQKGGRAEGLKLLNSFLYQRGQGYTKEMSSPVTAFESCSRLSTHIAFGTLSIREIFQATQQRIEEVKMLDSNLKGKWPSALKSFSARLCWHCHFIQKIEDEDRIEFENMHPSYNGLREGEFNEGYFEAWKRGQTGYPIIDACMRSLIATGWLNFRMRAMLMSFASYHLWLHWRRPALYLAGLFTDYEPGIHYSQAQMQSGTTGINTMRIYNPIKQSLDQDPDAVFIRKWVPELASMNPEDVHTPWKVPASMNGYPMPIVDEAQARKKAADKLYGLRKGSDHKKLVVQIVDKHASRKNGQRIKQLNRKDTATKEVQLELPF